MPKYPCASLLSGRYPWPPPHVELLLRHYRPVRHTETCLSATILKDEPGHWKARLPQPDTRQVIAPTWCNHPPHDTGNDASQPNSTLRSTEN